jgi:hypothetical protein
VLRSTFVRATENVLDAVVGRNGAPGALVTLHLPPVKLWLIPATEAIYHMETSK